MRKVDWLFMNVYQIFLLEQSGVYPPMFLV